MNKNYHVDRINELLDEIMLMLTNEQKKGRVVDADYIDCVWLDPIRANLDKLRN